MDYLDSVNDKRKKLEEQRQKEFLHKQALAQSKQNTKQILDTLKSDSETTKKVEIVNELASKDDIEDVIEQLKEVQLAALLSNKRPELILANGVNVEDILSPLNDKISAALDTLANSNSNEKLAKQLDKSFSDFSEAMSAFLVQNQEALTETQRGIEDSINRIDVKPVVNVPKAQVSVSAPKVDLSPLEAKLDALRTAIESIPTPSLDTTDLMVATDSVRNAIENMRFPVPNYVLPYKDINGAATQVELNPDGSLPVSIGTDGSIPAIDLFGSAITGSRYNQVEIDYSTADPDAITDITVTKTSGGDATTANGQAVFSTGTSATGGIKAVTNTTVNYRPNTESYAAFSAIFTAGVANSYQRIGIYDTNNGFFVGYEGTSFGVTVRKSSVDTTVPQASFNVDTLTGGSTSKYTRNAAPEAIDFTKDNLYRIRYGWLGAAAIYFEVLSPDQRWVVFHIHRTINTSTVPSVANPNLPITLDARKTSGATNIIMYTACWAGGTTSNFQKITDTLTDNTLATLSRSVITGQTTGGGGGYVNVKVNPSGALAVESTSATPDTGTVTTASVTNSNTTVLASNNNRMGATIYNEGTVDCLVKLGSTASASSYTVKMIVDSYYEVPFGYTGIITGITASGTATLRVTEMT